jgi:hypothetical protein
MTRYKIEDMQNFAKSKGGKCLSSSYINSKTKLRWQCQYDHVWEADWGHIKNRGSWCPSCAGKARKTIQQMRDIAEANGGTCLSKEYINVSTKLEWMCLEGHTWEAVPNSIQQGSWCPTCGGTERLTINDMRRLAEERNGRCLSRFYKNNLTKLKWECAEGHKWEAVPGSIQQGRWCPQCNKFLKEEICRTAFEQLFDEEFPKQKPKWLLNSSGNRMELDGYCDVISVAFEYNGEQHHRVGHHMENERLLRERMLDDRLKAELCHKNGVYLFVLSYQDNINDIANLIRERANLLGYDVSHLDFDKKLDFSKIHFGKTNLGRMRELAEKNGGLCLSKEYLGSGERLKWQCAEGHTWKANPNSIRRGSWCPVCAGNTKYDMEEMHRIAQSRDGRCLSKEYLGAHVKLSWMCSKRHIWEATPNSIRRRSWCKQCSAVKSGKARRSSIQKMHSVAMERGGKCLSAEYVNAHTKLIWRCSEGHEWEATPKHIVNSGSWCPVCGGNTTTR